MQRRINDENQKNPKLVMKREKMTLVEEMKQHLPIPARPTKQLSQHLRKKGIDIDMDQDLNILNVFDSGDIGGIICAIETNKKHVLVISLTHLVIKPDHPLSNKIHVYQKERTKSLQTQHKNLIHPNTYRLT